MDLFRCGWCISEQFEHEAKVAWLMCDFVPEALGEHRKLNPAELSCVGIHKTRTCTSNMDLGGGEEAALSFGALQRLMSLFQSASCPFPLFAQCMEAERAKADGGGQGFPGRAEFENRESLWIVSELETSDGGQWAVEVDGLN